MCFSFAITKWLCFPQHPQLLGRGNGWLAMFFPRIDPGKRLKKQTHQSSSRHSCQIHFEWQHGKLTGMSLSSCRGVPEPSHCSRPPAIPSNPPRDSVIRPTVFPAKHLGLRQSFCHKFPVTTLGNKGAAHCTSLISGEH